MGRLTLLQFILFIGVALVGLAAFYAAGLAFGMALAGAAVMAVLVLLGWLFLSNLLRRGRAPR